MNNNELDNLVESFLSPKQQSKVMDLKELFALFESMEKTKQLLYEVEQQIPTFIPQQEDVLSTDAIKKYQELVKADDVETPDRQTFDKLLREQLDSIVGAESNPLVKLILFVEYLTLLKQNKISEEKMGKIFAAIIFSVSILKMIREYYSAPSAAGFLYERFIAYFFHGVMPASTTIEDVVVGDEKWSLKLKAEADISGSIDGMYEFFKKYPNGIVKYLISQKSKDLSSIISYAVGFNSQQFESLLVSKGQKEKYQKVKKAQEINNAIKSQIKDLSSSIRRKETQMNTNDLERTKQELESQLVYQNSSDLQFSFSLKDLQSYLLTDEPIVLKMTTEDVNTIMANNSNLFNSKIDLILKQVNSVANKVNNYFLSGQKEIGDDALTSIETLGAELNDVIYGEDST
jgi:hypothetical protein